MNQGRIQGPARGRRARARAEALDLTGAGPALPELASPLTFEPGGRLRPVPAVLLALGAGLVAGVLVDPLLGVAVLALVAVALRLGRRGRAVLTLGALAAFVPAAAFMVLRQLWRGGLRADFTWPTAFDLAHYLAWVALLLLAADVVIEVVNRRRAPSA